MERGPLVYSLPIAAKWTPVVEEKWSTEAFPSWEARPTSEWNYGLAVDASKLADQVQVQKQAIAEEGFDPWAKPPLSLTVPARKIAGWALQGNPEKPEQKFTPPLPEVGAAGVSETVERITLAPYGSTQLRVTIFPVVKG